MLTRLYGKHNISYNIVVNTNPVNKQANYQTDIYTYQNNHKHTNAVYFPIVDSTYKHE